MRTLLAILAACALVGCQEEARVSANGPSVAVSVEPMTARAQRIGPQFAPHGLWRDMAFLGQAHRGPRFG